MLTKSQVGMISFLGLIIALGLTASTAAAQSGKQDYEKYCADCHGLWW